MPEPDAAPESSEELSFDKAQFDDTATSEFSCSACGNPIRDSYFRTPESVFCSSCRWALEAEAGKPKPGGSKRFGKAFLYGLGGAAAGTLVYFLVLWGTGYEVGLISIVVGWLVGKAVFLGSEQTGGRKYQVLAVALTYFSICASYAPLIVQEMMKGAETSTSEASAAQGASPEVAVRLVPEGEDAAPVTEDELAQARPAPENMEDIDPGVIYSVDGASEEGEDMNPLLAVAVILAICMAAPFLSGLDNIFGLIIIGIGMYEAWKLSASRELAFEGPFSVGAAAQE